MPFETNTGDSPDQALTLLDHELVRLDAGTMVETVSVEGRAENMAEDRLRYVPVKARFFNDRGEQREIAITNTTSLDAGRIWALEVRYPGSDDDARSVSDDDIAVTAERYVRTTRTAQLTTPADASPLA